MSSALQPVSYPALIAYPNIKWERRLNLYLKTARNPNYGNRWRFDPWQVSELYWTCDPAFQEGMHLRSRGASKSRDMSAAAVFLAYQRNQIGEYNRVLWYAGADTQLNQVIKYFKENRYVCREKCSASKIALWNGNTIELRLMSEKQAVSARADYVFFDEEQSMKKEIYQMALGTLVGGSGKKIHMGTTELDTVLDDNFIALDPHGLVHTHTIEDCSWTTPQKEIETTFRGQPQFIIDSQLYCRWIRAGGCVFVNIEQRDLTPTEMQLLKPNRWYGLDPNPKSGHALVGVRAFLPQNPNAMGFVYVDYEIDSHILEDEYRKSEQSLTEMVKLIQSKYSYTWNPEGSVDDTLLMATKIWSLTQDNASFEIEENNGQEFLKTLWRISGKRYVGHVNTMIWTEDQKCNRIYAMRLFKIIVSPKCAQTWHHLKHAVWDPKDPKAKMMKSPDQHYLDACIHACQMVESRRVKN